ncbi:MAG: 50S ribosomal protein L11 methyltransferase [Gaiellaceae bacterium]
MTDQFVRVTVRAPLDRAEEARAAALELAPGGYEESENGVAITLTLYVEAHRVDAIRSVFADAEAEPLAPGWEDAWRAFHHPVRAGGVWVGPPWEQPPVGEPAVVIDPGRAFGTGAHPTTRLCVELLAIAPRGSLLDVGCGSGVLAIAAARLGYGPLVAVDDDPVAVEVTRANALANRVALEASVVDATANLLPPADMAVANILLGPVESVLARLRTRHAITSGYLAGERPSAPGWTWVECRELDGWAADLFLRETV